MVYKQSVTMLAGSNWTCWVRNWTVATL